MLFVLLDRILQNASYILRWIIFLSLPIFTVLIHLIFSPNLPPWRIGIVFLTTSFVFIGNEIRRIRGLQSWSVNTKLFDFLLFIIISFALLLISELNGFTDIAVDNYGLHVWLYLCTGTLGTILVFILSNAIISIPKLKQILLVYGNNSQEVYEIHPPFFYLIPILLILFGWTINDYFTNFESFWILRFFLGVTLSLLISTRIIKKNKLLQIIFKGRLPATD
jgi:hypothetical protein